ncbi:uncharacterized protein TNCV_127311 [Trichonephila clavipes]|nr:uncharacterized protein TNCV_127311 [Trichonephila clavipes]
MIEWWLFVFTLKINFFLGILGVSGRKISKTYGLLLSSYPSECNKLFIHGLEAPPRVLDPIRSGRTCAHYSAIADGKLVTLISLVKMWMQQQNVQCVLWITEFKSVTRVQRLVRTEWNVVNG